MDDEVYALFVVVLCLATLAMPTPVQPTFALLAGSLAALAYRASAQPAAPRRVGEEVHDISEL